MEQFSWPNMLMAFIALSCVMGTTLWFRRRRPGFRVVYDYTGVPRVRGVLQLSRSHNLVAEFTTLYSAVGFVKSLVDRGYTRITLSDLHHHESWVELVLDVPESDDGPPQYELKSGPDFPIARERFIMMLATETQTVFGDLT